MRRQQHEVEEEELYLYNLFVQSIQFNRGNREILSYTILVILNHF